MGDRRLLNRWSTLQGQLAKPAPGLQTIDRMRFIGLAFRGKRFQ